MVPIGEGTNNSLLAHIICHSLTQLIAGGFVYIFARLPFFSVISVREQLCVPLPSLNETDCISS